MFNLHIQNARLSLAHVPSFAASSLRCRKKTGGGSKGVRGACSGEYKGVQAVRPESVVSEGVLRCYGIWNVP